LYEPADSFVAISTTTNSFHQAFAALRLCLPITAMLATAMLMHTTTYSKTDRMAAVHGVCDAWHGVQRFFELAPTGVEQRSNPCVGCWMMHDVAVILYFATIDSSSVDINASSLSFLISGRLSIVAVTHQIVVVTHQIVVVTHHGCY
jgi:hypothetical protein